MAGMWWYPCDPLDCPTADHLHQRLHQHQTFLRHLTGKSASEYLNPNHPDLDLTDNIDHYLIEVELPGVKSADEVKCHWTSSTSLMVYGTIQRAGAECAGDVKSQISPTQFVAERRIGTFARRIHFPVTVDMEKMTAKLEAGLLTITVPKMAHQIPQGNGNVEIEVKA